MSGLQLTDPPSDDLNETETETVNYGTDTTTNPIPPNPNDPASQRTPAKVSFAYDASLKQASTITPGMATQDDSDEEEDGIDFLGTVKKGGSDGTMAGPKSDNDHYVKVNQENLEDTTAYDAFIPKVSPASPFAKVCFEVGSEKNLVLAAQTSTQVLENLYGVGVNMPTETRIQLLEDQPAPFPLLSVMYPGNKIVLLHGIRRFTVPFGQQHEYKGETMAFLNDSADNESLPLIIRMDKEDFQEAKAWFCPDVNLIMDANHTSCDTLPVPDYYNIVITTKIIPIPLMLVPLFLNGGDTLNTVGAFQMFMDEFYDSAPEELKAATQYIYDFLLAATGYEESLGRFQKTGSQRSQLASKFELVSMDQALTEWAMNHFGGILHRAQKFDKIKAQSLAETVQQPFGNVPPNSWNTRTPLGQAQQISPQQLIVGAQSNLIIRKESVMGSQTQVLGQAGVAHAQQGVQHQLPQENQAQGNTATHTQQAQVHGQAGVAQGQGNSAQGIPISTIPQAQVQGQAGVTHVQQGVQQHFMQGNATQGNPTLNTQLAQIHGQTGAAQAQQGFQQQLPNIQAQANKQKRSALRKQQQHQQQQGQALKPPPSQQQPVAIQHQIPQHQQPLQAQQPPHTQQQHVAQQQQWWAQPQSQAQQPPYIPFLQTAQQQQQMTAHQFQAQQSPYPQQQYMAQQQQQPYQQQQFQPQPYYANAQLPPYPTGPQMWNQMPYGGMGNQYQPYHPPSIPYAEFPTHMDWYNSNNNISASGKSAKMLNGSSKFYILGLCGRSIQDDVPEIFRIFDSNEDAATKFHALNIRLRAFQEMNTNVRYTLRKETFNDLIKHVFHYEPHEKNMMKGFTPFCLQKLDQGSEIDLRNLEQRLENIAQPTWSDLVQRENSRKFSPITDVFNFLTAIENTHAMSCVLFTSTSPLTKGLQELRKTISKNLHNGQLDAIGHCQTDWFAHLLWGVYECMDEYFQCRLSEQDLFDGSKLANPLAILNQEVARCTLLIRPGCPKSLLTSSSTTTSNDNDDTSHRGRGKRKDRYNNSEDEGKGNDKKPRGAQDPKKFWRENTKFDASLKATKQAILKSHRRTNLGQLLRANETTIVDTLKAIGLATTDCGRFHMWGGCYDKNCSLNHTEIALTSQQNEKVNSALNEGSKKLSSKKVKQE